MAGAGQRWRRGDARRGRRGERDRAATRKATRYIAYTPYMCRMHRVSSPPILDLWLYLNISKAA